MLDDGRLLLVIGYDEEHDNRSRYAVMDADEFLNGGFSIPRDDVCGVNGPTLQRTARWAVPAAAEFFNHRKDVYP